MVHLSYDDHVNHDLQAKQMAIGAFRFAGFWLMAGFVAASLLSIAAALLS